MRYILDKFNDGFYYSPNGEYICISNKKKEYEKLPEDKYIEYLSDSITHEFMHHILYKEFNKTVSKLFDTIESFFYNDRKTMEKLYNVNSSIMTWEHYIKTKGIQAFYNHYHITEEDIFEAIYICGGI